MLMGGTSLIIMVGVDLDTMSQVEALLKMHHHEGLTKKGKINLMYNNVNMVLTKGRLQMFHFKNSH